MEDTKRRKIDDVIIVDKISFKNKLDSLIKDGFNSLHVVSDFDRTLTTGTNKKVSQKLSNDSHCLSGYF